MLIQTRPDWHIPDAQATPERVYLDRRRLLAAGTASAILAAAPRARGAGAASASRFDPGRAITAERAATTYNNYYEFGTDKDIWQAAQAMKTEPWTVQLDGMVEKPRTIALPDLIRQMPLEDRVYRHRCVEAWAMTVPWRGFPLAALVKLAAPRASAKYVTFTTALQPDTMVGLQGSYLPFPYLEGVTIDEAANDLPFLVTGMYGHDLPKQDGAPLRLVLPWKYGFKSAKAIVKIGFTDQRPMNFWQAINPDEYGFWANVNPAVPHPRWSQAQERLLGSDEMVPTQLFNGYGSLVAPLYTARGNEKLYM